MPSWINNSAFEEAVHKLKIRADDALSESEQRRRKNVIDPFQTLLLSSTFSVEEASDLIRLQQAESAIRGMSSALGDFHQTVLGSVRSWENHDAGYDLKCSERHIIAEVKNKWNTMNSSNRRDVQDNLSAAIRNLQGEWTGYLVLVIPKNPDRYEKEIAKNVFEIDGASFYQIVTGFPNAIHDLFDELCERLVPSEDIAEYCKHIMKQSLPPRD